MSTVIERSPAEVVVADSSAPRQRSRRAVPPAGLLAAVGVAFGVWAVIEGSGGRWLVVGLTVVAWAVAGVVLSLRRGDEPLGPLVALVAGVGGATALGAAAFESGAEDWSAGLRLTCCGATRGRLLPPRPVRARRSPGNHTRVGAVVGLGYLAAVGLVAVGWDGRTDLPVGGPHRVRCGGGRRRNRQLRGFVPGGGPHGPSRSAVDGLGRGHRRRSGGGGVGSRRAGRLAAADRR